MDCSLICCYRAVARQALGRNALSFRCVAIASPPADPADPAFPPQSFEQFINLNAHSPEYVSLYIDDKLRRGMGQGDMEMEGVLDRVMALFRCAAWAGLA